MPFAAITLRDQYGEIIHSRIIEVPYSDVDIVQCEFTLLPIEEGCEKMFSPHPPAIFDAICQDKHYTKDSLQEHCKKLRQMMDDIDANKVVSIADYRKDTIKQFKG
jgi:hypothetical protein